MSEPVREPEPTSGPEARFEAVRGRLLALLKKRFGGKDPEADDAIAAGMAAAWQGLCRVPPGIYEDGAIAYTRAVHAARRHIQHERQRRSLLISLDELGESSLPVWLRVTPDFSEALIERLTAAGIAEELWGMLTPREKQMIRLRYLERRELHEIAETLGCAMSNVRGVLNWGLNRYRRAHGLPTVGPSPEKLRARRAAPGPAHVPNRVKGVCQRGHPFSGPNLRINAQGFWRCRACEKAACAAARARKKAKR